jgi:arylsulfatase A-like enzyme
MAGFRLPCQVSRLVLRRSRRRLVALAAATVMASPTALGAQVAANQAAGEMRWAEPGRTVKESPPPAWPRTPVPAKNAPNILLILTDDVGYGASSTFGGPIPTPTLDTLAAQGLRYTRYHNSAMCSPTRAAILTGRNPHSVGMGATPQRPAGYEGYTSVIPASAAALPRLLKDQGYNTAMFGKSHLVPEWEMSQTGPFDRWPTGMGFEYFYGFLSADVSQFAPVITENTTQIEPPRNDPNYHFDADLADRAIGWMRQQQQLAPDKPFFIYYATGSAHTPHHAPPEWMAAFKGKFDQGWDAVREQTFARQKAAGVIPQDAKLTPRPAQLPAWDSLTLDQRRVSARLMEAYAASLAYGDHQIGRVIQSLKDSGEFDNTLIIFIEGDNGGSAEGSLSGLAFEQSVINRFDEPFSYLVDNIDKIGGPELYTNYPAAWGWAMNSPFPWYKQIASHLGGTRNGMVVSWPSRIASRGLRDQFLFATDIAPTILEAASVAIPRAVAGVVQKPMDGISFSYSFDEPKAASRRQRQIFEVFTNLGIYDDGWMAGTSPGRAPWEVSKGSKVPLAERRWELYHLDSDYSQSTDVAARYPERLAQMKALFWSEAARSRVTPVRDALEGTQGKPVQSAGRSSFRYLPGITRIPESAAPQTIGRSFRIEAEIVVPKKGTRGTLVTQGGRYGGYAFYVADGRLHFTYNAIPPRIYTVGASRKLAPGRHSVAMRFASDAGPGSGGTVTISQDGMEVGRGRIEHTLPIWISHTDGFDVGTDTITPISDAYSLDEATFSGQLLGLTFDLE